MASVPLCKLSRMKKNIVSIIFLLIAYSAFAQHPLNDVADAVEVRYASSQPVIGYTLKVDAADLSSFEVEMLIRNVPDTFRVAMVAHPEYDDRFWRYVEGLRVETKNGSGNIVREDSAVWRIVAKADEILLRYKIHLPAAEPVQRAAWRPFLSPTGGLIGGPHSFMYIIGATLAPSYISLKLPQGWMSATGLTATADPSVFFAPSVFILTDAPILIGYLKTWRFSVDQVPHRVIYWPLPDAKAFDTAKLVNSIQEIVQQSNALFGRLPYREYSFLFQDGAYGALEHSNSVTIGIPSSRLEQNFPGYLNEIVHEYFHTWNLVRIHPVEYGDVSYKKAPLSKGLWFSEGMTMFYADLLVRRAGLPPEDPTRIQHVERLMRRYYNNSGNNKISPEKVSMAEYGPEGMLGDYIASSHLQGELLGTMLDLVIRDATNGKYSIDDVMRKMMERFSGVKGFTNKDIEQAVSATCGKDMYPFFRDHVYGNKPIDFNKYLMLAGMRSDITWVDASDSAGKPVADLRVYAFRSAIDNKIKIRIMDPLGCWGKAGLHTGDIILSMNSSAIRSENDFQQIIRRVQIGDAVVFEIQRSAGISQIKVVVSGYKQARAHIEKINEQTERQRKLYAAWIF